jgi:hypothetical protein
VRPLDRAGLRDAVATAAVVDLDPAAGAGREERWDAVVVGEVGHATWDAAGLHVPAGATLELDDLAAPGAATTVALELRPEPPGPDDDRRVGTAVRVRVSARTPDELVTAGRAVVSAARARGLRLDPRHGRQAAGLRGTVPLGAPR